MTGNRAKPNMATFWICLLSNNHNCIKKYPHSTIHTYPDFLAYSKISTLDNGFKKFRIPMRNFPDACGRKKKIRKEKAADSKSMDTFWWGISTSNPSWPSVGHGFFPDRGIPPGIPKMVTFKSYEILLLHLLPYTCQRFHKKRAFWWFHCLER